MAYAAVSGGREAIEESIKLLDYYRSGTDKDLEIEAIENKLSLLVDRVMSEAGLYAKTCAALALKQSEGAPEEAVFLLRAYRSTLREITIPIRWTPRACGSFAASPPRLRT
jgi:alpha-D-ribose 1-methylphosphonate 5-triphosphate synthase subunit PhnI